MFKQKTHMLKLENLFIYSKKKKHDYNSGLVKEIHFNTKSQFDYGQSVFTKFFSTHNCN